MLVTDAQLQQLATRVAAALSARAWRLVTAESLTGGQIAKVCTDIPGSSAWFDRAFVTYSPQAKQEMLGLSSELLERAGIVSEAVAAAMASAALARSQAEVSIAVTGVAGPGGGSAQTPVGTLCCAWMDRDRLAEKQPPQVETCHFNGDRDQVRRQSVQYSLARLLDILA
ncbi:CinA family protein [Thiorhodovibrio frisius]|uniref:Competence/damage-inducible protein CinA-like protein n=1 Tax=Thiorhodovibrio frisius TaxID=631362 RepID=H8YYL8_9GAMM|nr:CinA family protein [Thiorhodovibrio frisius]EIC23544.1 competence/damage-inducible protein CinA-like protein [Thiorhodovibrio frisius]WPL23369.1 Nicotinamide-nucleotide amidohydrolase PncC [Thiorhodovibrio frisius]